MEEKAQPAGMKGAASRSAVGLGGRAAVPPTGDQHMDAVAGQKPPLVGQIGHAPLVVVVPAASTAKSFKDLLAQARAEPGKLSYATAGNGSSGHLAGEALKQAAHIDVLHGLLPICCGCKKIRDDAGSWRAIEEYLTKHSGATFSHGICPECFVRLYPDLSGEPEAGGR